MGFMDKAKEAAQKAQAGAQQAAAQGQAKFNAYQQSSGAPAGSGPDLDRAFATLGRAFHAEQRQGGSREAVVAALGAVDAALAAPPTPQWQPNATPPPGNAAPTPAPTPPGAVQAGNFTLDDL